MCNFGRKQKSTERYSKEHKETERKVFLPKEGNFDRNCPYFCLSLLHRYLNFCRNELFLPKLTFLQKWRTSPKHFCTNQNRNFLTKAEIEPFRSPTNFKLEVALQCSFILSKRNSQSIVNKSSVQT